MIVEGLAPAGGEIPDVCIVGSGPVGMAVALECEKLGRSVLVLEAGGADPVPDAEGDTDGDLVHPQRHAPLDTATCHAFGGTSWWWGGRCIPLDPVDFAQREHVPEARWPIDDTDVLPYLPAAADYLDCGDATFQSAPPGWPDLAGGATFGSLERWSRTSRLALVHRARIERSGRIRLVLRHRVVDLALDRASGRLDGLLVAGPSGEPVKVVARDYILATGGLGTARLLLVAQRSHPDLFGGRDGPLGRYYMGHAFGKVADVVFADGADAALVDFELDGTGTFVRRRFGLSAEVQQRERLLNTAFYVDNPAFHDYQHRSGILSLVFLALSVPPVGRRLVSEGIRRVHVGREPYRRHEHLANVLLQPLSTAKEAWSIFDGRYLSRPRRPGFLIRNRGARYALFFHGEQTPRADSRVTLGDTLDRHGMPRLVIDFDYCEADAVSIVRAHEILDAALRAAGKGRLEYRHAAADLVPAVLGQLTDGFHQIGTTRMGDDPASSVVDRHCRVHGLANLHVASSSVFCSSGQANPTFVAAALGVRLARHLAARP